MLKWKSRDLLCRSHLCFWGVGPVFDLRQVPYLRVPLLLQFFNDRSRFAALCCPRLQAKAGSERSERSERGAGTGGRGYHGRGDLVLGCCITEVYTQRTIPTK